MFTYLLTIRALAYTALDKFEQFSLFGPARSGLQSNIGFTLRRVLAVFTRSAVTPPKVNRFG